MILFSPSPIFFLFIFWLSDIASPCLFLTCTLEWMCTCIHANLVFYWKLSETHGGFYFSFSCTAILAFEAIQEATERDGYSFLQRWLSIIHIQTLCQILSKFWKLLRPLQNIYCIQCLGSGCTTAVSSQVICHSSVLSLLLFAWICWNGFLRRVSWVPGAMDWGE